LQKHLLGTVLFADCKKTIVNEESFSTYGSVQGTQFTYDPSAQSQNRGLSGYNVPSAANSPCGSNSAFGDADLTSIEGFPIAASNNPGATYSLRCASTKEQQGKSLRMNLITAFGELTECLAQGGSIQAAGMQNGDLFVFALENADAGTL